MKYNVTAYLDDDREFTVSVSCRYNAKIETLYRKSMNEIGRLLIKEKILSPDSKWTGEKPNIWINGCVGAVWFMDPFINVSIIREDGCVIAQ